MASPQLVFSNAFKRDLKKLPLHLSDATWKQIRLLIQNRTHPSLRLKKLSGYENVWEVRIAEGYRICFSFGTNIIVLYRVGPHDITRRPI